MRSSRGVVFVFFLTWGHFACVRVSCRYCEFFGYYFAPGRGVKYRNEHVCMSFRSHLSKTTRQKFTKFSVHVSCDHGLVLRWRQGNMLRISGFVDDIMSAHDRPGEGDAIRAYTQSDSWRGSTEGEVWYLQMPCSDLWLTEPVQLIAWKNSSAKWAVKCRVWR